MSGQAMRETLGCLCYDIRTRHSDSERRSRRRNQTRAGRSRQRDYGLAAAQNVGRPEREPKVSAMEARYRSPITSLRPLVNPRVMKTILVGAHTVAKRYRFPFFELRTRKVDGNDSRMRCVVRLNGAQTLGPVLVRGRLLFFRRELRKINIVVRHEANACVPHAS
jgi:hypothetical protein